jgi:hypothetical protein
MRNLNVRIKINFPVKPHQLDKFCQLRGYNQVHARLSTNSFKTIAEAHNISGSLKQKSSIQQENVAR